MKYIFQKQQHKGFVILFTILISAIIMVIGLGMYSIATRETVLSGTAREAQYAFYAADAGVECALYAQSIDNAGNGNPIIAANSTQSFDCGGSPVSLEAGTGGISDPYVFRVMVDTNKQSCAQINIFDGTSVSGQQVRRVIAQGYNICDPALKSPITTNPNLVERDLDTLYNVAGGGIATSSATTTGGQ
jgi:Tfp pilus assembly protein PilX